MSHHDEPALRVPHATTRSQGRQQGEPTVGQATEHGHGPTDVVMGKPVSLDHVGLLSHKSAAEWKQIIGVHLPVTVHHGDEVIGVQHAGKVVKPHRNGRAHALSTALKDGQVEGAFSALHRFCGAVYRTVINDDHHVHFSGQRPECPVDVRRFIPCGHDHRQTATFPHAPLRTTAPHKVSEATRRSR